MVRAVLFKDSKSERDGLGMQGDEIYGYRGRSHASFWYYQDPILIT